MGGQGAAGFVWGGRSEVRVVPCQDKQAMLRWLCDRWRHLMICTVMFDRIAVDVQYSLLQ